MRVALGILLLLVIVAVPLALAVAPHLPAAERGRRLAERTGCFACHGPGGQHGVANPGRNDKTVPDFDDDDMMMYAKSIQEVREWIEDGVSKTKSKSETWREQRKRGALKMPAFERRLDHRQIDDLVAYVAVMAEMNEPDDSLAHHGLERAEALGCVGCHGPGGRLAQRNPGSLKGYVPSWDGADFPDLVRSRTEFGEWVEHGVSKRFEKNALAMHFLRRAVLHMPAYGERLAPGDVDAIWAYVGWLRSPAGSVSLTSAHRDSTAESE
jgi:mono/diheme cytochrome c family protein